jgi:hypothetical protein|tara:strand:+ start:102 stop:290 length:189 start_codon:yes stop_codon:yes gene_type:complete
LTQHSVRIVSKAVGITKEQMEYIDKHCLNFSKFVQRAIEKEMLGEIPFDILVVEKKKGVENS